MHTITKADVGGAQTYVLQLATLQVEQGHQVRLVAGSLGRMAEHAAAAGIEVVGEATLRRDANGRHDIVAARAVGEQFDRWHPDVVHAHSSKAGLLARLAARRRRLPAVYTAHGWPFQAGAPQAQRALSWGGESFAGHWWGEVICLTHHERALARRWHVVPDRRLHLVPNGLRDVDDRADLAARADDAPVELVMVARFSPPKDQLGVIAALARMRSSNWRMTFVGDGPGLAAATDAAQRAGLGERIRFLGDRGDVETLLATADIALLWSRYEGMPLALMEAMRAGVACVANELPGTSELLADASGLLLPHLDVALADGLDALVADPGRRRAFGAAARQRFEQRYDIRRNAEGVADVYRAAGAPVD